MTIYMCWQLTVALMRIIMNHGAMPDGINGLAQVNAAAELYRVPKTSEIPKTFPGIASAACAADAWVARSLKRGTHSGLRNY